MSRKGERERERERERRVWRRRRCSSVPPTLHSIPFCSQSRQRKRMRTARAQMSLRHAGRPTDRPSFIPVSAFRPSFTIRASERRSSNRQLARWLAGWRFGSTVTCQVSTALPIFSRSILLSARRGARARSFLRSSSYVSSPPRPKAVIPTRPRHTQESERGSGGGDKLHGSCSSFG